MLASQASRIRCCYSQAIVQRRKPVEDVLRRVEQLDPLAAIVELILRRSRKREQTLEDLRVPSQLPSMDLEERVASDEYDIAVRKVERGSRERRERNARARVLDLGGRRDRVVQHSKKCAGE